MIFFLQPSYHPSWRLYVPRSSDTDEKLFEVQEFLKAKCRWGNFDKSGTIEGIECLGYEFSSAAEACDMMREAMQIFGHIDEGIFKPQGAIDHARGKHIVQQDDDCISCQSIRERQDLIKLLKDAREELRLLREKDDVTPYDPTLRTRMDIMLEKMK